MNIMIQDDTIWYNMAHYETSSKTGFLFVQIRFMNLLFSTLKWLTQSLYTLTQSSIETETSNIIQITDTVFFYQTLSYRLGETKTKRWIKSKNIYKKIGFNFLLSVNPGF